ncbi:mycofactocin-associated electron transfer flavoprotein alpha subunit [Saccharopolyspora sp. 6V]|uniref:mycofactocin-associated electron transfer flavoprotein alpha subunit n=1 Tax=Saccharopolyspora sp. 6V TaxID=2877239 RepID=UPI001CD4AAB0|nr:mycofactocin-associated electron transfer flavoprotein alpha subunit [Saccharopolyspora sp. 6V]MCA1194217.1 mycofactocin-associated electron transfer flavoprotein alpha subunit [Saccharopolyspora sp. 6V]
MKGEVAAVLVVRDGVPPVGGDEAVAEAGGAAVLVGSGCRRAVAELPPLRRAWCAEAGDFAPGAYAAALAPLLAEVPRVVLPGSPDGRDLAPRLAAALDRPLLAGATRTDAAGTDLVRWDGRLTAVVRTPARCVVSLVPGVRGALPAGGIPEVSDVDVPLPPVPDAEVLEVLEPDPATAELGEARRLLGAGAGLARGDLTGPESVALLEELATALGASVGATRVVTDAGWTAPGRQIGTTGAVVSPELYLAFGVSGAAQHLGGLDASGHVVSVNTDASCPMTAMADLGLVTDAQRLLAELVRRLARIEEEHHV